MVRLRSRTPVTRSSVVNNKPKTRSGKALSKARQSKHQVTLITEKNAVERLIDPSNSVPRRSPDQDMSSEDDDIIAAAKILVALAKSHTKPQQVVTSTVSALPAVDNPRQVPETSSNISRSQLQSHLHTFRRIDASGRAIKRPRCRRQVSTASNPTPTEEVRASTDKEPPSSVPSPNSKVKRTSGRPHRFVIADKPISSYWHELGPKVLNVDDMVSLNPDTESKCEWKGGCGKMIGNTREGIIQHLRGEHGEEYNREDRVSCYWGPECHGKTKHGASFATHIRSQHLGVDALICPICTNGKWVVISHGSWNTVEAHVKNYHKLLDVTVV